MLRTISTTSSRISGSPPEICTTHGLERVHVAAIIGRLQVARLVARAAVVAVFAVAGARVGDFE